MLLASSFVASAAGYLTVSVAYFVVGVGACLTVAWLLTTCGRLLQFLTRRAAIRTLVAFEHSQTRADLSEPLRRFAETTRSLIVFLEHATQQASRWRDEVKPRWFMRWFASSRDDEVQSTIGVSGEVWVWLQTAEALADTDDPQADLLGNVAAVVREALLRTGPFAPRLLDILGQLTRVDHEFHCSSSAPYRDRLRSTPSCLTNGSSRNHDEGEHDEGKHREGKPDERQRMAVLEQHGPMLRAVAARYANDRATSEDFLQEIKLAVWRALDRFRGEASLRTYVARIAHYRAARLARRQQAFAPVIDEVDTSSCPEEWVGTNERRLELDAALAFLPESQRAAFTLRLRGLSYLEIGRELGISERNASVRITRARKALRERLAV